MAYEKLNLADGQKFTAEHVGHIEDGIVVLSEEIAKLQTEDYITYTNLFNKDDLKTGGWYSSGQATWTESNSYHAASAPIYLTAGNYLFSNRRFAFGDNGTAIYAVKEDGTGIGTSNAKIAGEELSEEVCHVTIDSDGYYALNVGKTDKANYDSTIGTYMLISGSTIDDWPPKYVSYGNPLKIEKEPEMTFNKNPLYKKIAVFDGDSICQGSSAGDDLSGWAGRIGVENDMIWVNVGRGGGTITQIEGHYWIGGNIDTIIAGYPNLDFLILEGGTNDADLLGEDGLGSFDPDNKRGTYDTTTFSGALETLLFKAVTNFRYAKIGFIIAHMMGTSDSIRRKFFDRATEICKKWGIPVIDLWHTSHIDNRLSAHWDSSLDVDGNIAAGSLYTDGQHLTAKGYEVITPKVEAWMKTL